MISVSKKDWSENKVNQRLIDKISQDNDFSPFLSKLIVSRKFNNEEIYSINNNIEIINNFKNNNDFINASLLFENSINKSEKICIFGDYDVDGSCASTLLIRFLKDISHPFFFYIPDREKDGYGPNPKILEKLLKKKPKLFIFLDCGSNSIDSINFLNKNKIKSLIIDHHQMYEIFPKRNIIINTNKKGDNSIYNYLCATSLTYFFLKTVIERKKIKNQFNLESHLILVLLATVCDVMPIRNLNRTISINVLKNLSKYCYPRFKQISNFLLKKNKITIDDIGYLFGPILNSGGRLGFSSLATKLLSSDNNLEIKNILNKLIFLNENRKIIENKNLNAINFENIYKQINGIVFLYNPLFKDGLIGILASRVKEKVNKPCFVMTAHESFIKGSARSVIGFNVGKILNIAVNKKIIINGGGHQMAGGFLLKKEKINIFKSFLNNEFNKNFKNKNNFEYDSKISLSVKSDSFYEDIDKLEPYGTGNSRPIFLFENLKVNKPKVLNNKHIFSILISNKGKSIPAISFNSFKTKVGEYLLNFKEKLNVIGTLKYNYFNNKKTYQLIILDLIL